MSDAFISYARQDQDFVRRLYTALHAQNRDIWVDWQGIPPTVAWLQEVFAAIEASDTFIFVLSPDSIASHVCGLELAHALEKHKRIIPVVYRQVEPGDVHPSLAALNWIFFRDTDDFDHAMQKLLEALDLDVEYLHTSTRILLRAQVWESKQKNASFVLRGRELAEAISWYTQSSQKQPRPTRLQIEYILASRKIVRSQRSRMMTGISGILALIIILSSIGIWQREQALTSGKAANQNRTLALSRQLASQANSYLDSRLDLSMLLSIEAERTADTVEARNSLLRALTYQPYLTTLFTPTQSGSDGFAISPDGSLLAIGGDDQTVTFWNVASKQISGSPLHDTLAAAQNASTANPIPVTSLAFNADGTLLATASGALSSTVTIWDVATRRLHSNPLPASIGVSDIAFSPKGRLFAYGIINGTVNVWDLQANHSIATFPTWPDNSDPHAKTVSLAFSPDGKMLAVASDDVAEFQSTFVTIWDVASHQVITTFHIDDTLGGTSLVFCLGGKVLAIGGNSGAIHLWDAQTRQIITTLTPAPSLSSSPTPSSLAGTYLAVSSDGQLLAAADGDNNAIAFWKVSDRQLLTVITSHTIVKGIQFVGNSNMVATIGNGHVALWQQAPAYPLTHLILKDQSQPEPFMNPQSLYNVALSPDSRIAAIAACDPGACASPTLRFWDNTTDQPMGSRLPDIAFSGIPASIAFSPDGKDLATVGSMFQQGSTLHIWDVAHQQLLHAYTYTNMDLSNIYYSPDGTVLGAEAAPNPAIPGASSFIVMINVQTGQPIAKIVPSFSWFRFIPGTRDMVYSGCSHMGPNNVCSQQAIYMVNYLDGQRLQTFDTDAQYFFLNHQGTQLFTEGNASGNQTTLTIWDLKTGRQIHQASSLDNQSMVVTPDDHMVASSVCDAVTNDETCQTMSTISLGDAASLASIGPSPMVYPDYEANHLATTEDPNHIFAWSPYTGAMVSWDVNVHSWIHLLCAVANRNLTRDEWNQYLSFRPYEETCGTLQTSA